jgi:hypothetical protein
MQVRKRSSLDDASIPETTSTVILLALVGLCVASALVAWYGGLTDAYATAGNQCSLVTSGMLSSFP